MDGPHVVLSTKTTHAMCFRLRLLPASSPPHPAESSSLYCAPPVRLRLLSTPLRSDAVTFDYGALAYPDMDSHHAVYAPSRAHWEPHPRGDGWWSARVHRDEGVAPTGTMPCILWEPRPRGDGLWTGKLGARSPLQKSGHANFIGPVAERPERIERLFDLRQTAFFRDRAAWKA